jgi:hypothetical protein
LLAANEEHEEHGGPDQTRDHPERHDAPSREHTDYEIARCHEHPSSQGGYGHQTPVVDAEKRTERVWHEQADERDAAPKGNRPRR